MEEFFETHKTADIVMTTISSPNMVDSIPQSNFGNAFHHQNGCKQCQNGHKHTSQ